VTTSGILAWVATGATASANGVRPKPARNATLSLVISSVARRLELSAFASSSLMTSSIFLPATVSPFCCTNAELCELRPVSLDGNGHRSYRRETDCRVWVDAVEKHFEGVL
jgi:hypothetical protein